MVLRVGLLALPDVQAMCIAPLAVFEMANLSMDEPGYEVVVVSQHGGTLRNSFGMEMATRKFADEQLDTLIIGTVVGFRPPAKEFTQLIVDALGQTRRLASICTGAYFLAAAGLLDGRRATTHWGWAAELQREFPNVIVDADRIFINEGQIWTSAGMSTSIDMALGMVERDYGAAIAKATARTLVLHHRRHGGQSQHSVFLEMEPKTDRVRRALAYASANLREPLTIDVLADVAALSPRQFTRLFARETGQSPAKVVEALRIEAARVMLENGRLSIEEIAIETGFGDRDRMRRAFLRNSNQTPQVIRSAAAPLAVI